MGQFLSIIALVNDKTVIEELTSRTSKGKASMTQSLPLSFNGKSIQIISGDTVFLIFVGDIVITRNAVLEDTHLTIDTL